jgi:hypothetical protein
MTILHSLADDLTFQHENGVIIGEITIRPEDEDAHPDIVLLGAQLQGSQYWAEMNLRTGSTFTTSSGLLVSQ